MSKSNGDIPPNHGGIVLEPNKNDVLSGRGGRINAHPGNVQFRDLVKQYRGIYLSPETKKLEKVKVATKLVDIVRSMDPPGRFLKEDENGWVEIGDARARKKAGQAMREKADEISHVQANSPATNSTYNYIATSLSPQQLESTNPTYYGNIIQTEQNYNLQDYDTVIQHNNSNLQINNGAYTHPNQNQNTPFQLQQQEAINPNYTTSTYNNTQDQITYPNTGFNRIVSQSSTTTDRYRYLQKEPSIDLSSILNETSTYDSQPTNYPPNEVQYSNHANRQVSQLSNNNNDDSWVDQRHSNRNSIVSDSQAELLNNSTISTSSVESDRRKLFRTMKFEESSLPPSSLPPAVQTNNSHTKNINNNELMQESLISLEMRSVEMKKSTMIQDKMPLGDMKMDSVGEMIVQTLDPDNDNELHSASKVREFTSLSDTTTGNESNQTGSTEFQ